jgi:hypothetical protein
METAHCVPNAGTSDTAEAAVPKKPTSAMRRN